MTGAGGPKHLGGSATVCRRSSPRKIVAATLTHCPCNDVVTTGCCWVLTNSKVAPPSPISDHATYDPLIHLIDPWFGTDFLQDRIIDAVSVNVLVASILAAMLMLPLALAQ